MNNDNYLMHFGVRGMKWGVRRYRNPDGTLTEEGRKRYGLKETSTKKDIKKALKYFGDENVKKARINLGKHLSQDKELNSYRKEMKGLTKNYESDLVDAYNKRVNTQQGYKKAKYFDDSNFGKDYDSYLEALDDKKCMRSLQAIQDLNIKIYRREQKIASGFVDALNDAKLKDLNYTGDKKVGRKMLENYGGFRIDDGGRVVTNSYLGVRNFNDFTRDYDSPFKRWWDDYDMRLL